MSWLLRAGLVLLIMLPCLAGSAALPTQLLQPQHWLHLAGTVGLTLWLLRSLWQRPVPRDRVTILLTCSAIVLISLAFLRASGWFAAASLCTALALASGAMAPNLRIRLLLVLLLTGTGLPPAYSNPLHSLLSDRLSSHTSTLASLLGVWNARTGLTMTTSRGTHDLTQIVQSPVGISGLLLLLGCWLLYRNRTLLQILLTLLLALPILGMHTFGCLVLAIVLTNAGWSLLPVWLYPILMLPIAALLLLSTEQFMLLLTGAIIPLDRRTVESTSQNAFNRLWDRAFAGRTVQQVGEIRLLSTRGFGLSPHAVITEFLKDWFLSRRKKRFTRSLPVVLVIVALPLLNSTLVGRHDSVGILYQQQLQQAIQQQDTDRQELLLRALISQFPSDPQRRLRLAEFLWNQRSQQAGWAEYEAIAQQTVLGAADAQLWIVRNSMSAEAFRRLPDEQMIQYLQRVLQSSGENAEAHALLAQLYFRSGEQMMGETQLRKAANSDLQYVDDLVSYCRRSGRPLPDQRLLASRVQQLSNDLQQRPNDDGLRTRLSTLLRLTDRTAEAEQLLRTGLSLRDSSNLRKALVEVQLAGVRAELSGAQMIGDSSLLAVREALTLDPTNEQAPPLAALLRLEGAEFGEYLVAAEQHWKSVAEASKDPEAQRRQALLTFAAGRPAEAVELFARISKQRAEDAIIVIVALMQSGRQSDALAEAKSAAAPLLAVGTIPARLNAAELFCRAAAFTDAEACLPDAATNTTDNAQQKLLQYGGAWIALHELDYLLSYPGHFRNLQQAWSPQIPDASVPRIRELIVATLQSPQLAGRAADRLYLLSLAGGIVGRAADDALLQHRATARDATQILATLGTQIGRAHV